MARKNKGKARAVSKGSRKLHNELAEVADLIDRRRWREADERLAVLDREQRPRLEVISLRLEVAQHLQDHAPFQALCERWLAIRPSDPDVVLALAGSYLMSLRIALALQTFRRFLARWPDHDQANNARKTMRDIEGAFFPEMAKVGLGGPEDFQLAVWHEEIQIHGEREEFAQAKQKAEALLRARPQFAPALNNLSDIWAREGNYAQAIATAQRVLEFDPENAHALPNLVRFRLLSGRKEEAEQAADRLRSWQPANPIGWVKMAETWACLGDDTGILAAMDAYRRQKEQLPPFELAVLEHLAGVAAYRLGREADARRYWKTALQLRPNLDLAQDNLADLGKPVDERHAAWPFHLNHWLPEALLRQVRAQLKGANGKKPAAVSQVIDRLPGLETVVPILLDRGDPAGRTFALLAAQNSRSPAMKTALRDFALSQRGPLQQRTEAAKAAIDAGLLPAGAVRMWARNTWTDVLILSFEIHWTPSTKHSAQVRKLAQEAHQALLDGHNDRAEQLLNQALALAPDAPDLLNNLATAYRGQGRFDQAEELVRRVHVQHPDYWFGRINVAHQKTRAGLLDEAAALLNPMLQQQRLHGSEFAALAAAQIELLLARGERQGCKSWLELWESAIPDDRNLPHFRRRVRGGGILDLFRRWSS